MSAHFRVAGIPARSVQRPVGEWRSVPSGFLDALRMARHFVLGTSERGHPFTFFVHLHRNRVYATNNVSAVEIEPGDNDLPNAVFSVEDIRTLIAFKSPPAEALLTADHNAFGWPDGAWCRLSARRNAYEHGIKDGPARIRDMLEGYWREPGFVISDEWRKALLEDSGLNDAPDVFRVAREQASALWPSASVDTFVASDTSRESFWAAKPFYAVVKHATAIDLDADPDERPASFSLPNGKGLIVESSKRIVAQ